MQLQLIDLHKSFGEKEILHGLSLEAVSGRAFGLLGHNGAGKTTTIRLLMNVFRPNKGQILLDQVPLENSGCRVGYLPEEKGLYPRLPLLRQMIYIGELRGLSYSEAKQASLKGLDRVGLLPESKNRLETLSKGNQQKVQLAVALLHNPDLVIFDEPFSGLDPVNATLLREIVREQVQQNKIVFFSSHQMSYVEDVCNDVAFLRQGTVVLKGDITQIKRSWPRTQVAVAWSSQGQFFSGEEMKEQLMQWRSSQDSPFSENLFASRESEKTPLCQGDLLILNLPTAAQRQDFLQALLQRNLTVEQFRVIEPSLEDLFIQLMQEEKPSTPAAPDSTNPEEVSA